MKRTPTARWLWHPAAERLERERREGENESRRAAVSRCRSTLFLASGRRWTRHCCLDLRVGTNVHRRDETWKHQLRDRLRGDPQRRIRCRTPPTNSATDTKLARQSTPRASSPQTSDAPDSDLLVANAYLNRHCDYQQSVTSAAGSQCAKSLQIPKATPPAAARGLWEEGIELRSRGGYFTGAI